MDSLVDSLPFPSLAEQLNITDIEVSNRKRLFDITSADEKALRDCRDLIERNAEKLVATFCKKLCNYTEFFTFVGDRDTYERWVTSLKIYICELFNGTYEIPYVTRRLMIGKIQYKLNISQKYYMAGSRLLQELLTDILDRETANEDALTIRLAALRKIMLLDAQFILDSYTAMMAIEVDAAKSEVRDYVADLERRAKELSELSRRDELTGLLNRRAFSEEARRAITLAQRSRHPLSMICFDLDNFKDVNDLHGHLAGDGVLKRVSAAIHKCIRETDLACRYGGDEFLLLLPMTPADQARVVCERIHSHYAPAPAGDIDFSFGIAQAGPHAFGTVDEIIQLADDLMYKAKSDRGNGVHVRIHLRRLGE